MSLLQKEFQETARRIGTEILEMTTKQRNESSIKKGIAGGQKFVKGGIFFKLCQDNFNIYHGEANAQKAAGHELRSLLRLLQLRESVHLRVPLSCIIDHLGFRLLALSILPIKGRQTLVYGSSNAGKSFVDKSSKVHNWMRNLALELNLKPHIYAGQIIFTCIDLEVHSGTDSRYCKFDFSICF